MFEKPSKPRVHLIASFLAILLFGFIWGYLSHRNKIFPYKMALHAARTLGIVQQEGGIVRQEGFKRVMIQSRSKKTESYLESLGYVDGTYDVDHSSRGVLTLKRDKIFDSYRFYNSRSSRHAFLVNIDGNTVHEWKLRTLRKWQSATLMPNGDILVIIKDFELLRIDKDSNLLWRKSLRVHHDLDVYENEIYVLTRRPFRENFPLFPAPFLEDMVSVFSESGQFVRQYSLVDLLWNSEYRFLLSSIYTIDLQESQVLDVLHTNNVDVLDGRLAELNPIYKAGNILVCMRNINVVMIFDPEVEKIVWLWGPNNLTFPHHPTVLGNGNVMIFDNGTEKSRIVEIDPMTGETEWVYRAADFFSEWRGSAQRLVNGNTLITESDTGYVFEVTKDGDEVWRFANPDVHADGTRMSIWRMEAFEKDEITFLAN